MLKWDIKFKGKDLRIRMFRFYVWNEENLVDFFLHDRLDFYLLGKIIMKELY